MSGILTAKGTPVDHVASDVKKAHDPEELARERARFNGILQGAFKAAMEDYRQDPEQPAVVQLNEEAWRKHHVGKWEQLVDGMDKSSFPHPIDRNALGKVLDQYLDQLRAERELKMPMHQVEDLSKWELLPVGELRDGTLYIHSHAAVCISVEGMVKVWLRGKHEPMELWCADWMPNTYRHYVVESLDYKMAELNNVLMGMRIGQVARLNAAQLEACLVPMKPERKRFFGN